MDMNRPVFEEERPQSSRISSSKSNLNTDVPIEEPRSKSDLNEDLVDIQNNEELNEKSEIQISEEKENTNQEENQDQNEVQNREEFPNNDENNENAENQADNQVDKELEEKKENEADDTIEQNQDENKNEINEENENKEENVNQNDSSLDESYAELNSSENQENNEKNKDTDEQIYVHKTVKRKARQPNKFADGNLILEEETDEDMRKSPGPPPLEPISQNLDNDMEKSGQNIRPDLELGATTPDRVDLTIEDDYQDLDVEVKPTREELIARYQAAIEERDRLQTTNNQLHHKLADFFRKKKSDDSQNQSLFEKSSQEHEQRYIKYITTIDNLKKQMEMERLEAERELDELKYKCDNKKEIVDQDRMTFTKMKKDAVSKSASTRSGKHLTIKDVEAYIEKERLKEIDVISVRIENIKLKNILRKKENELKAKEEFGEGLHMIDFEQLKIENQTYNEKIEERNEELMKLKKKINNTVQILTHVKEKLQYVGSENEKEKYRLIEFDEQVKKNRDSLNRIKQSKDSLRLDNGRLKQNSGLLGNTILLRDFEECVDKNENLEIEIERLKRKHAELILTSRGIKQKINQFKGQ